MSTDIPSPKKDASKTSDTLGITFNEIHSDEPHEEIDARKSESTLLDITEKKPHRVGENVFDVGRAFEGGNTEVGTIVSDKRGRRRTFGENLSSVFSELWKNAQDTVATLEHAAETHNEPAKEKLATSSPKPKDESAAATNAPAQSRTLASVLFGGGAKSEPHKVPTPPVAQKVSVLTPKKEVPLPPPPQKVPAPIEKTHTLSQDIARAHTDTPTPEKKHHFWSLTKAEETVPTNTVSHAPTKKPVPTPPVAIPTPSPTIPTPAPERTIASILIRDDATTKTQVPTARPAQTTVPTPVSPQPITNATESPTIPTNIPRVVVEKSRTYTQDVARLRPQQVTANATAEQAPKEKHRHFWTREHTEKKEAQASVILPDQKTYTPTVRHDVVRATQKLVVEAPTPKTVVRDVLPPVPEPEPIREPEPERVPQRTRERFAQVVMPTEPVKPMNEAIFEEDEDAMPVPFEEEASVDETTFHDEETPFETDAVLEEATPARTMRTYSPLEPGVAHTLRTFTRWIIIGGIALTGVILAVVLSNYVNIFAPNETVVRETISTQKFFDVDSQTAIPFESGTKLFLETLTTEIVRAQSGVVQFYPTVPEGASVRPLTVEELFSSLSVNLDGKTLRALDNDFMLGSITTTKNEPFIVLRSYNFDVLFSGMLAWERTLYTDLTPLFGTLPTTGLIFTDAVQDNKSIRILHDSEGNEILLYSFINQNTVVITTSSDVLAALISHF